MNKLPRVTVLMPVYNGEKYLNEAIESILRQSFTDFEFLIINDGSCDSSVKIIESYNDKRIRLVHNESNKKLIETLNTGLDLAHGEYIARMDCDDISLSNRLFKQVEYMDKHLNVGICGAWVETIGEVEGEVWQYHTESEYLKCQLMFDSPLAHPVTMFRKSMLEKYKLRYDKRAVHAEDWYLWQEASKHFALANLPMILLKYRILSDSVSRKNQIKQQETIRQIHKSNIDKFRVEYNSEELNLHCLIGRWGILEDQKSFWRSYDWLKKLINGNKKTKIYPLKTFERVVSDRWYFICERYPRLKLKDVFMLIKYMLFKNNGVKLSKKQYCRLFVNFLRRYI